MYAGRKSTPPRLRSQSISRTSFATRRIEDAHEVRDRVRLPEPRHLDEALVVADRSAGGREVTLNVALPAGADVNVSVGDSVTAGLPTT